MTLAIDRAARLAFAWLVVLSCAAPAMALIQVGKGNNPVRDDNWPAGAVDVANLPTRVGWWEGPPFGGGRTELLYRGETPKFQDALDAFGKIRAPELRLIVREGPHEDGILNEHVDWSLVLWNPLNWHNLYNDPASTFESEDPSGGFRNPVEPPTMTVFVAGEDGKGIDFPKVNIPKRVKVTDERATANGYFRADGSVLRGDVYDMTTSKPVPNVTIALETYNGKTKKYDAIATGAGDANGHFELKNVPPPGGRVIVSAPGYVTRVAAHDGFEHNALHEHTVLLAKPATVSGTVTDEKGQPIAGATVRPDSILAIDGRGYLLPDDVKVETEAAGKFEITNIPAGHLVLFVGAKGMHQPDMLKLYKSPASDLKFQLGATGIVKGSVTRADGKPAKDAQVSIDPEGDPIGKWGGGMNVKPDGTFQFDGVPPGKYTVSASPGMARIGKDPTAKPIEVKAGETLEVKLTKK